jgi:phosphohistidine phosphatase SixA
MMRHAESEERPVDTRDHDRPITEFGRRTAQQVILLTASAGSSKAYP